MFRSVFLVVFFAFQIVCIAATATASSVTAGSLPNDAKEYEAIFGHKPTEGQMQEILKLKQGYENSTKTLHSYSDFKALTSSDSKLIVVIGHNENGEFKFPSGDSVKVSTLASDIETKNKLGVILTCNGARCTNLPAPRLKINYNDAFQLAAEIKDNYSIFEADIAKNDQSQTPMPNQSKGRASTSKSKSVFESTKSHNKAQCRQIISRLLSARGPQSFYGNVNKIILRAEAKSVMQGSAKIAGALATGSVLMIALDDDG